MIKVAVIFTTDHPDTIGNACRIEMMNYLSQEFDISIFTNQPSFVKLLMPKAKVIELPKHKDTKITPINDLFYFHRVAKRINVGYKFLFMFDDTAKVALWSKIDVFQYVYQYGIRTNKKRNSLLFYLKSLLRIANEYFYIKGLISSKVNFIVSQPIINILKENNVNNCFLVPHGINIDKYQQPIISKEHLELKKLKDSGYFIITYSGWVSENRGLLLMLDCINECIKIDKNIVLIIAGADADSSNKIETFTKHNQLKSNIINLGKLDSALIPGILFFSDVCLSFLDDVPAHRVSPPQKVIEYFAAGKPVICNRILTHELLINNGKNGYIIDWDSTQATEAIIKLKNDKKLYKHMVDNALQEANKYNINKIYGEMVRIIKENINAN